MSGTNWTVEGRGGEDDKDKSWEGVERWELYLGGTGKKGGGDEFDQNILREIFK